MASLRFSKWRSFFTMSGIIIGIASVVTVVSLGEGLKQQVTGQINNLGTRVITVRPGKLRSQDSGALNLYAFLAPSTLTTKDVASVAGLPPVNSVAPLEFVTNAASGSNGELDNLFVAGTTPNAAGLLHLKMAYGSFFDENDPDSTFVVIGSDLAYGMFGELNPIGETVHIMGQDFIVRGVLAPTPGGPLSVTQADYNSSIFMPTAVAEPLTSGHTNIMEILAEVKKNANINTAAGDINRVLSKNHGSGGDFTVLKQDELLDVNSQVLNTTTGFVSGIAAISLLVGSIGIMNIMLVSVTERTREIGIRKAIGATDRQIMRQFLTEGLVITITGGVIGVLISLLINLLLRLYTSWKPDIDVWVIILAAGISIAAGLIFSLLPALKAARKNPIDALRGE
ncbi:MAG TPA: ABC transporter permease [Candidatus Saccharimonadales bacterium]|nr:ABC transporter permease [Candidatus Saccharimonadales bacterium]